MVVLALSSEDLYTIQDLEDNIPDDWDVILQYFNDLEQLRVVTVVSAGNETRGSRRRAPVNTLPQLFAEAPFDAPIFVVGSVQRSGSRAEDSQELKSSSNKRMIWAPGENVECAGLSGEPVTVAKSGTSFAAPMV